MHNPPAFSRSGFYNNDGGDKDCDPQAGMTLRDYFAAHAPPMLEEWAAYHRMGDEPIELADLHEVELLCRWRGYYADKMLKMRGAGQ